MRAVGLLFLIGSVWVSLMGQEEVVRLYPGKAPGSEHWTHREAENTSNLWKTRVVYNVADPTLTVFRPKPEDSVGTGVIICPGGAFFALSIDSEGFDVARWLVEKGITCFVLKYRLVECRTKDPTREVGQRGPLDEVVAPIVKLALGDGLMAIRHVRERAKQYGVRSNRIGILGFSAGGTVAASVGLNYHRTSRPDFIAPIYLAYAWAVKGNGVPSDAPPLFALAASDDELQLGPQSVEIYQNWIGAGKSAELHLFARGGHGFGMRRQGRTTDRWIERFHDWMVEQGWGRP